VEGAQAPLPTKISVEIRGKKEGEKEKMRERKKGVGEG
jgi:hypothetical protein